VTGSLLDRDSWEKHARSGKVPGEGLGVSVVICSHNGETLLPRTLAHLKNQQVTDNLKWEVLVIDNASTDNTASVAHQCWGDVGLAPLRVVYEPRLGLCYARERAFAEARHDIVSFIDDDNWVATDWVATVYKSLSSDSDLAALGSINTAVADTPFPEWYSRYCAYYAAWAFCESAKLASWVLNGAGMTIRKSAWQDLRRDGFKLRLVGRTGSRLTACEDLEIGCALQLSGWKIRVDPKLRLQHYMTPQRLQWHYLRKLLRGCGEGHVVLDSYLLVSQSEHLTIMNRLRHCWWVRLSKEALELLRSFSLLKLLQAAFFEMEGNDDVAAIEIRVGRLLGLMQLRSKYGVLRREIAQASWRKTRLTA
jgi:glycosyltransferase involved in cell wall biosynthesis